MDINGKTAIISGGASGLGAATARLLHERGANIFILDLNEEKGKALVSEIGSRVEFAKVNVTEPAEVEAGVKAAMDNFGSIHALINCAGIGLPMKTVGKDGPHNLDTFIMVLKINLIGTFDVLRWAAYYMQNNEPSDDGERGVIVNTASVAAFDGQIGQAAYAASKAGVVGMTLPIARDMARSGIRVVTIAPGLFETPLMAGMSKENKDALAAAMPFPNRLGNPDEFASLAGQIIENPMLNGETIRLDGAIRMAPK